MFMRFIFTALLAVAAATPALAAGKDTAYDRVVRTGTIRCGYFAWPPYLMKDPNTGAMSGINHDYMEAVGKTLGLKIEWTEEVSPGTAIAGLDAGRYDVMCSSLWPDEARLKHALLTAPTLYSAVYAVARWDDARFDGKAGAINAPATTIAALEGEVTFYLARDDYPEAKILSLPQMSDGAELLQSVASRKADVTFVDRGIVDDFNKTNGNALKIVENLPPARVFPEVLAVSKDEIRLKMMIDNAIGLINDRGLPATLIAKYPDYGFFAPKRNWE